MSEYTVLCLTAANGEVLTKSFDKEGIAAPFNKVSKFTHDEIEATNLEVLYHLLKRIENQDSTAIVSGMLTAASRKLKTIKRNKDNIKDAKRKWICLDVDSYEHI